MKLAKRFLTVGVALALTLGLNIPAFAAEITINNAAVGETYTAYKLFSLSKSGDGTAYSYYIENTGANAGLIALLDTTIGLDLVESADGSRYNVNMMDENTFATDDDEGMTAAALAAALNTNKKSLPASTLTGRCETGSSTVTIQVPDIGYYFVDSSLGALCGLYTNEDSATINEKNSLPHITKTVKEDSTDEYGETATIDGEVDTIYYKLTVNTGTGYAGLGNGVDSDYTITDELPEGIAYNEGSIALPEGWTEYSEETEKGDYTVSYDAQTRTLTIVLKASKLATLGQNKDIEITYNADARDVEGNLAVGTGHQNNVTLKYKNQTMTDKAVVKTYDLGTTAEGIPTITKVDGSENPVKLQGVKFVLSKTVPAESEGKPTTKTVYATFDQNNYLTGWVDSQGKAIELVTDSNGNIKAEGLDADTYILTETETLPGYNLLDDTITVVIDKDGNETYKLTNNSTEEAKNTITVVNEAGSQLPTTGGMGTTVLYIAGAALVLGAGITLVVRRRMNSDQ